MTSRILEAYNKNAKYFEAQYDMYQQFKKREDFGLFDADESYAEHHILHLEWWAEKELVKYEIENPEAYEADVERFGYDGLKDALLKKYRKDFNGARTLECNQAWNIVKCTEEEHNKLHAYEWYCHTDDWSCCKKGIQKYLTEEDIRERESLDSYKCGEEEVVTSNKATKNSTWSSLVLPRRIEVVSPKTGVRWFINKDKSVDISSGSRYVTADKIGNVKQPGWWNDVQSREGWNYGDELKEDICGVTLSWVMFRFGGYESAWRWDALKEVNTGKSIFEIEGVTAKESK